MAIRMAEILEPKPERPPAAGERAGDRLSNGDANAPTKGDGLIVHRHGRRPYP